MLHARSYMHATRPGYVTALDAAEQGEDWRSEVHSRRSGRTRRVPLVAACLCLLLVLRYTGMLRAARKCECAAPSVLEQQLAAGAHPHPQLAALTDLVVVTGHAVFTGTDFSKAQDADSWYLEEYQQRQGPAVVDSFVEHIRVGVREAAANPRAVLLFSGGATRESAGPLSEALSYYRVASALGFFGDDDALRARVHTEEYARDSFENLLFSMCRFHELTGTWPRNVTVIGYAFKEVRFRSYHRAAIDFPASRFHYIGTGVPNVEEAAAGEREVVQAWAGDPYACGADSELAQKRHARDPFARGVPYFGRCAALHGLLTHCGPQPYAGPLPWA